MKGLWGIRLSEGKSRWRLQELEEEVKEEAPDAHPGEMDHRCLSESRLTLLQNKEDSPSLSFSCLLHFFFPSNLFPSEPALRLPTLLLLPSVIHVCCVCVYSFCPVKDALISALN